MTRSFACFSCASLSIALIAAMGCDDGNAAGDAGTDTDTGEPDWGETTPCANEPGPDEICVPGGKYLMGCVPGDTECEDNEKPLVEVTLSPFFVDKYEAQIKDVIDFINAIKDDDGVKQWDTGLTWIGGDEEMRIWSLVYDPLYPHGDRISVVRKNGSGDYEYNPDVEDASITGNCQMLGGIDAVAGGFSWLGAKMFCEWKGMRLPTEAQWEAAARGQTIHEYPCGSDIWECQWGLYDCHGTCSMWFYESVGQCCYPWSPDQAGEGCLSPFGVNGMYGNAREWTADYHDNDHAWASGQLDRQQTDAEANPYGSHIAKGGSVNSQPPEVRISARSGSNSLSDNGFYTVGVRCVRPDEPLPPQPDAGVDAGKK